MATTRPFAYNTGAPISGTDQVGDLAVGVTDQEYSSNIGGVTWWMGPDEELGYVIAVPVSSNTQPTPIGGVFASVGFYRTDDFTDSSFISIAEYVANEYGTPQTFSTAIQASNWLTNNGFWNSYAVPLVLLDAGNLSSYPGSGSTWFDLTTGDNATLINTPTYSSSFSGILQFDDASLEYGTIPNLGDLQQWTIEAWFRLTSPLTSKVTSILSNEFDLVNKLNFSLGTNNMPTNNNLTVGFFDGAWHSTTGFIPQTNVWYQVVGTYDGSVIRQYINGVASGGTLNYVGTPQSGGEVRLMKRWDSALSAINLVDGDLSIVKIYDKALNTVQINSSWDQNKTRFGL
jgi:hypothetical protein